MSWIFREHKGGIIESMKTAREFDTKEEMLQYIYDIHKKYAESLGRKEPYFDIDDIVIDESDVCYDDRIGWNTLLVCVKRYGNENYKCPQCIGQCAKEYDAKRYEQWMDE